MKASERILELQRQVIDEMALHDETSESKTVNDFILKITGTSNADIAQQRLKDPRTMIAAVIAYLEEKGL